MRMIRDLFIVGLVVFGLTGASYAERIVIEGSTTVLPIAQKTAEVFMEKNPQASISVRGGGSSVGIASLLDGTCDIADASRAIKTSEIDQALANGIDPVAHVVAMDGIAVVIHSTNPVSALTLEQIKAIYTGKITQWSDVGGSGGKIVVISRDTSSGTFEAFNGLALGGAKVVPSALMQASNQAVGQTVARTPGAIGYIGLGYLTSDVKAVTVEDVECSVQTVLSGKYPISRPLFMYTNGKPQGMVKQYLEFVKGPEGQKLVQEQGFVGLQ